MAYATDRIQLYDCRDNPIGEIVPCSLRPNGPRLRKRILEIGGEHSLTIATTRVLEKGMRALTVDGMGKWSEWVVDAPNELHASGRCAVGTYTLVWSMQSDLEGVFGDELRPGIPNPVSATTALEAALNGTNRWTVGTVDVMTTGALSMYDSSAWQRVLDVANKFGGELDSEISVSSTGVISRRVSLRAHLGSTTVTRRFDWRRDLKSVRRIPKAGPRFCRVIPRGKGEQVESSTGGVAYTRRINIKSVNDGIEYLRDEEAEEAFKLPDGNGGWEYPITIVYYDDIEDPQELKDTALADMPNHTRPQVTYIADVVQLARAGMDVRGIALGDDVHVVDHGFCEGGLRIQGRVLRMEIDDITGNIVVVLGNLSSTLADTFSSLSRSLKEVSNLTRVIEAGGTPAYVRNLLGRINAEVNATGGYTYLVPGIGNVTYDTTVSDPAEGTEASQVTEMRGGTLRFANTRTASGDWDYTNVITPEGYLALAATIARITAGFIGSPDGGVYIDLDNHVFNMGPTPMMGETSLSDALDDARRYATDYLHYESGELTLGLVDSAVRNVITATRQAYRTDSGDIAWYGLDENEDIWKLFIDNAQVNDTLRFGNFAWIARQNGNMTVKWVG